MIRTACNFNSCDTEQYLLPLVSPLNAAVPWKHLDQAALCEATFRCLRGSQSVVNSESSPSRAAARTTARRSPIIARTCGRLRQEHICSVPTSISQRLMDGLGGPRSRLNELNSVRRCLCPPLIPRLLLSLPPALTPALPVCTCTPLKLTRLCRLAALHGQREQERVKGRQADR